MEKNTEEYFTPEVIELEQIPITTFDVTIVGDTDLYIHKLNDEVYQELLDKQSDKVGTKGQSNFWNCVITSLHWLYGAPDTFTKESFNEALINNVPCISAFGMKKSLCNAVVRYGIDKYATKFDACVNIASEHNLIPITFKENFIDDKLIKSKRGGAPVRSILNRFSGWTATFTVECVGNEWPPMKIINLISLAGFGLGIGSGTSSGYGRYRVVNKSDDITFI